MTSTNALASLAPKGDKDLAEMRAEWHHGTDDYNKTLHRLWRASASVRADGPMVFMVGDSISRGFAFGTFAFDPDNPISALQHPDRLFNILAAADSAGWRAMFSGVLSQMQMQKAISVALQPGDVVLYQDWGWRPESYKANYHNFASFASLINEFPGVNACLMNSYAAASADPQYNFSRACSDDERSPNDAIANVAGDFSTGYLDIAAILGNAEARCTADFGFSLMLADGVHPNIFGNALLAGALFRHFAERTAPFNALKPLLKAYAEAPSGEGAVSARDTETFLSVADSFLPPIAA